MSNFKFTTVEGNSDTFHLSEIDQSTDLMYLRMAEEVEKNSPDPSTKVGAVLVPEECWDENDAVTGFNNIPEALLYDGIWENREEKYKNVLHAEMDVLHKASVYQSRNATLYTSFCVCDKCAPHVVHRGISKVVTRYPDFNMPPDRFKVWTGYWKEALTILTRGGVDVIMYRRDYSGPACVYHRKGGDVLFTTYREVMPDLRTHKF